MRKRILIWLLAIVVIGVVALVVSQPKPGTLEWHKREYLAAKKGPLTITMRAQNVWNRVRGSGEIYIPDIYGKRLPHQRALIKLGYLEEREFVLTNWSGGDIGDAFTIYLPHHPRWPRLQQHFFDMHTRGTNVVIIVAPREEMPGFAEAIRKADSPETGK